MSHWAVTLESALKAHVVRLLKCGAPGLSISSPPALSLMQHRIC